MKYQILNRKLIAAEINRGLQGDNVIEVINDVGCKVIV